jgi:hypothetical protein
MNLAIAAHSYREATSYSSSQVGFTIGGWYGRVFGLETNDPVVKVNYKSAAGNQCMKKLGKKASKIVLEFVNANIEQSKSIH